MTYDIGICLRLRAWNFVFESELCSGGVYPRLEGGDLRAGFVSRQEL
jgi:hypothetical protein